MDEATFICHRCLRECSEAEGEVDQNCEFICHECERSS